MPVSKSLKILHWNAQGITTSTARSEFMLFIENQKIDIFLLNETYLNDHHTFKIPGFIIYRRDRETHGEEFL